MKERFFGTPQAKIFTLMGLASVISGITGLLGYDITTMTCNNLASLIAGLFLIYAKE